MTTFNKQFDELVKTTLAEESQNQQNLLEESQNMNEETDANNKIQLVGESAKSQGFFQDNNSNKNNDITIMIILLLLLIIIIIMTQS